MVVGGPVLTTSRRMVVGEITTWFWNIDSEIHMSNQFHHSSYCVCQYINCLGTVPLSDIGKLK